MAEIAGHVGGLYSGFAAITGTGIAFVDSNPDTITDTGSGFVSAGFEADDEISVSGSTNNNGHYTIASVVAGTITLVAGDALTAEAAGANVTIYGGEVDPPGTQLAGFFNWTAEDGSDAVEATDFSDGSARVYVPALTNWTGTAERHWLTEGNQEAWLGTKLKARFFVKYVTTPSGGDKAYYYEGDAIVTGISTNTPVDELVTQSLSFQGSGTLTLTERETAWP